MSVEQQTKAMLDEIGLSPEEGQLAVTIAMAMQAVAHKALKSALPLLPNATYDRLVLIQKSATAALLKIQEATP